MFGDNRIGGGRQEMQPPFIDISDIETPLLFTIRNAHPDLNFIVEHEDHKSVVIKTGWHGSTYRILGARKVIVVAPRSSTANNLWEYTVLRPEYVPEKAIGVLADKHVLSTQKSLDNTTFGR